MPYPNDWSAETVAALISGLLGTSTAENKSFGDASIDSNTDKILQSFTVNPGRRIASGYFESCAESGRKLYR